MRSLLLDQVLAFAAEDPASSEEVEKVLGVPSGSMYKALVEAVIERDGNKALIELKSLFDAGHDLRLFSANLLEYLRDCMVLLSAGDDEALFDVAPSEIAERREVAGKMNFAEAHQAYSILQGAETELRTSDHPRMTLEVAILRMCQIEPIVDLGSLMERLETMGGGVPEKPSRTGSPRGEAPASAPTPVHREPAPSAPRRRLSPKALLEVLPSRRRKRRSGIPSRRAAYGRERWRPCVRRGARFFRALNSILKQKDSSAWFSPGRTEMRRVCIWRKRCWKNSRNFSGRTPPGAPGSR